MPDPGITAPQPPGPVFLSVRQFAERSGLAVAFIERLVKDCHIKAQVIGRQKMIAATELARLPEAVAAASPHYKGAAHATTK